MSTRVLIIEDVADIREITRAYLEMDGYTVDEATDGRSACTQAAAERPDLVLLDIRLPDVDGWTLLEELRSEIGLDCPVVIISAHAGDGNRSRAADRGCAGYVTKPFTHDQLSKAVEAALAQA